MAEFHLDRQASLEDTSLGVTGGEELTLCFPLWPSLEVLERTAVWVCNRREGTPSSQGSPGGVTHNCGITQESVAKSLKQERHVIFSWF